MVIVYSAAQPQLYVAMIVLKQTLRPVSQCIFCMMSYDCIIIMISTGSLCALSSHVDKCAYHKSALSLSLSLSLLLLLLLSSLSSSSSLLLLSLLYLSSLLLLLSLSLLS